MSELVPDLPPIPSSWYTQIFSAPAPDDYKEPQETDPPPTMERLVFIGETIFELGAKQWLHEHFRKHSNHSLKSKLANIIPKKASSWGKLYMLPSRLSVTTAEQQIKLTAGDLFLAYLAAIYLTQKSPELSSNKATMWIKQILEYEKAEGSAESDKETSTQYAQFQTPIKYPHHSSTGNVASNPPARPMSPNAGTNGNTTNAVSLLNERVMKRGKALSWKDESTGMDHMKIWTVRVTVDDKEYSGSGHNKKQAKAAAAEEALKHIA